MFFKAPNFKLGVIKPKQTKQGEVMSVCLDNPSEVTATSKVSSDIEHKITTYQHCVDLAKRLEVDCINLHPDQIARALKISIPPEKRYKRNIFTLRKKEVLRVLLDEGSTPGSQIYLDALKILSEQVEFLDDHIEVCRHAVGHDYSIFDKHIELYVQNTDTYDLLLKVLDFEEYMSREQREVFFLKWVKLSKQAVRKLGFVIDNKNLDDASPSKELAIQEIINAQP